ncbi:MAG: hypothetical protein UT12_C0011G0011 [Candidatus Curtissbacteria bacterium GW2011_GWC2_38_9]|uniref:Uncharacterized protein n=2 Tax=Candidatus Curtissiibacteriota TaxID=1752717 RepID=A0A1F5HPY5_9BACT|nr:MAG: hypothetical protein UT12_C0011G0011 [Candidatus Curtissbacteria bacterium GW2011_GWC2_38_9]OGD90324.1 MAG: hypothetical protein A2Z54_02190 [Candidatus Curtissbacteria bacterium RIFCSPHIGHO2_02_39_8]OGE06214.1 MAG: hypothetical protein A2W70_03620 [Candidatus Curtissbacteria bacterium RIFCSPLOWO2_02_41_11]
MIWWRIFKPQEDKQLTLSALKFKIKVLAVVVISVLYGTGAYFLGKSSGIGNLLKIKGVATQKSIEAPVESPIPNFDSQSGSVIPSYVKLCANTVYGFEVAYPKDWFMTYLTDEQKCNFFAPYSFVIPKDTAGNFVPVKIEAVKVEEWPGIIKFYENPNDFQNVISIQNIQSDSRIVREIKTETTGSGILPKGYSSVFYLVFDAKTPLVVSFQQLSDKDNVDIMQKNVEDMVKSLRYF